ncbi:MAG: hypothetical protein GC171_11505 [Terrimonas sp.]|nr:hypothetical protein [Terrimonas sp.]
MKHLHTSILMIASAAVLGLAGLSALFYPKEILLASGLPVKALPVLFVQIAGALYLGFAMMNWMAKSVLIGGIYARPLGMGNFFHFMIGGISLIKVSISHPAWSAAWVAAAFYSIFALLFGWVLFGIPKK